MEHKNRRTLGKKGYAALCSYLDERDGGCIVCGKKAVQHHHVIPRSLGRWDDARNMVCLCPRHHDEYGKDRRWREIFQKYLNRPDIMSYDREHQKILEKIYSMKG